jgi:hypothetical protein
MKPQAKIPGAMLALFAFVLTVLLGIGGAAAVALWQQSATATMSVSAASSWPSHAISVTCVTVTANNSVNLTVTGDPRSSSSIASRISGGSYGAETSLGTQSGAFTFELTISTYGMAATLNGAPQNPHVDVRIQATFADQATASVELLQLPVTGNNKRISCPVAP